MAASKSYPIALQKVMAYLGHLPGIGGRTAERLGIALMSWSEEDVSGLGAAISELRGKVDFCPVCGNFTEPGSLCALCRSPGRRQDIICVVENVPQINVIEKSGSYDGLYHVLGGKLSPMSGIGPSALRIGELRTRLEQGAVKELLIALSPDVEGEATAHYLAGEFSDLGISISRIASGIPVGADLSFADSATLARAIAGRSIMETGRQ